MLDPQYGNVWTKFRLSSLDTLRLHPGDRVSLTISEGGAPKRDLTLTYVHTFGDVPLGEPLLYANSVGMLAVALNQKDFAADIRHRFRSYVGHRDSLGRQLDHLDDVRFDRAARIQQREAPVGRPPFEQVGIERTARVAGLAGRIGHRA